ncbi:hypothetical protein LUZ60_005927 [Juncus effusus]|nr:hypothetical protein LUZ60_005927 [Juncus effusus]
MTSASELFFTRRSRSGRVSTPFLEPDSDPTRSAFSDRDFPPRRRRRHSSSRLRSISEHVSRSEQANNINDTNNGDTSPHDTVRFAGTNQLPNSVLLARARVLERLRGLSLVGGRASISWGEAEENDVFRLMDLRVNQNSQIHPHESNSPFINLDNNSELVDHSFYESINGANKRPPGVTKEAFSLLKTEVFEKEEMSVDCCICLDKFNEGIKVLRLNCSHRFHPECLEPWVRKCGDCPYCRTGILS